MKGIIRSIVILVVLTLVLAMPAFAADMEAAIDNTDEGIRVISVLEKGLRTRVRMTNKTSGYTKVWDIDGDDILPINENGTWSVAIYQQVSADSTKYRQILGKDVIIDDVKPYLGISLLTDEAENLLQEEWVEELKNSEVSYTEKAKIVFNTVSKTMVYDKEKAATVQGSYVPNVDEVWQMKKGICYDYSSIVAAVLRYVGVPTEINFGYAHGLYHAWNTVILEDGSRLFLDATWGEFAMTKYVRTITQSW